jgi:hypothetical protein
LLFDSLFSSDALRLLALRNIEGNLSPLKRSTCSGQVSPFQPYFRILYSECFLKFFTCDFHLGYVKLVIINRVALIKRRLGFVDSSAMDCFRKKMWL